MSRRSSDLNPNRSPAKDPVVCLYFGDLRPSCTNRTAIQDVSSHARSLPVIPPFSEDEADIFYNRQRKLGTRDERSREKYSLFNETIESHIAKRDTSHNDESRYNNTPIIEQKEIRASPVHEHEMRNVYPRPFEDRDFKNPYSLQDEENYFLNQNAVSLLRSERHQFKLSSGSPDRHRRECRRHRHRQHKHRPLKRKRSNESEATQGERDAFVYPEYVNNQMVMTDVIDVQDNSRVMKPRQDMYATIMTYPVQHNPNYDIRLRKHSHHRHHKNGNGPANIMQRNIESVDPIGNNDEDSQVIIDKQYYEAHISRIEDSLRVLKETCFRKKNDQNANFIGNQQSVRSNEAEVTRQGPKPMLQSSHRNGHSSKERSHRLYSTSENNEALQKFRINNDEYRTHLMHKTNTFPISNERTNSTVVSSSRNNRPEMRKTETQRSRLDQLGYGNNSIDVELERKEKLDNTYNLKHVKKEAFLLSRPTQARHKQYFDSNDKSVSRTRPRSPNGVKVLYKNTDNSLWGKKSSLNMELKDSSPMTMNNDRTSYKLRSDSKSSNDKKLAVLPTTETTTRPTLNQQQQLHANVREDAGEVNSRRAYKLCQRRTDTKQEVNPTPLLQGVECGIEPMFNNQAVVFKLPKKHESKPVSGIKDGDYKGRDRRNVVASGDAVVYQFGENKMQVRTEKCKEISQCHKYITLDNESSNNRTKHGSNQNDIRQISTRTKDDLGNQSGVASLYESIKLRNDSNESKLRSTSDYSNRERTSGNLSPLNSSNLSKSQSNERIVHEPSKIRRDLQKGSEHIASKHQRPLICLPCDEFPNTSEVEIYPHNFEDFLTESQIENDQMGNASVGQENITKNVLSEPVKNIVNIPISDGHKVFDSYRISNQQLYLENNFQRGEVNLKRFSVVPKKVFIPTNQSSIPHENFNTNSNRKENSSFACVNEDTDAKIHNTIFVNNAINKVDLSHSSNNQLKKKQYQNNLINKDIVDRISFQKTRFHADDRDGDWKSISKKKSMRCYFIDNGENQAITQDARVSFNHNTPTKTSTLKPISKKEQKINYVINSLEKLKNINCYRDEHQSNNDTFVTPTSLFRGSSNSQVKYPPNLDRFNSKTLNMHFKEFARYVTKGENKREQTARRSADYINMSDTKIHDNSGEFNNSSTAICKKTPRMISAPSREALISTSFGETNTKPYHLLDMYKYPVSTNIVVDNAQIQSRDPYTFQTNKNICENQNQFINKFDNSSIANDFSREAVKYIARSSRREPALCPAGKVNDKVEKNENTYIPFTKQILLPMPRGNFEGTIAGHNFHNTMIRGDMGNLNSSTHSFSGKVRDSQNDEQINAQIFSTKVHQPKLDPEKTASHTISRVAEGTRKCESEHSYSNVSEKSFGIESVYSKSTIYSNGTVDQLFSGPVKGLGRAGRVSSYSDDADTESIEDTSLKINVNQKRFGFLRVSNVVKDKNTPVHSDPPMTQTMSRRLQKRGASIYSESEDTDTTKSMEDKDFKAHWKSRRNFDCFSNTKFDKDGNIVMIPKPNKKVRSTSNGVNGKIKEKIRNLFGWSKHENEFNKPRINDQASIGLVSIKEHVDSIATVSSSEEDDCCVKDAILSRTAADKVNQFPARLKETLWGITQVNVFNDGSRTFELMKPSTVKPVCVPSEVENIFVMVAPKTPVV